VPKKLFFSVGEPSGDQHAARLIESLVRQDANISVRGFGGSKMLAAGFKQDFDLTQLAVIGFAEVLPKLRHFFRIKEMARSIFANEKPDAIVLVDFPGFNWHIAALAKDKGVPVFYYMPPQLWAWGSWRIAKMKRTVDHVLCALPIEVDYFRSHGMHATLVGHPFFEHVQQQSLDQTWMNDRNSEGTKRIAVLPGSRRRELASIWPLQLKVIASLHQRFPNICFDIACLNEKHLHICKTIYEESKTVNLPIEFHAGKTSEAIEISHCVLMKSGSVSLEVLARRKAACVVYHASPSTYRIGRWLTNLKYFSLPNILADRMIVPEFLAIGRSTKIISEVIEAMTNLISDDAIWRAQLESLDEVHQMIGSESASTVASRVIIDRLK
jgi:lipid-A-disaccharide synthase